MSYSSPSWTRSTDQHLEAYKAELRDRLLNINIPYDVVQKCIPVTRVRLGYYINICGAHISSEYCSKALNISI